MTAKERDKERKKERERERERAREGGREEAEGDCARSEAIREGEEERER